MQRSLQIPSTKGADRSGGGEGGFFWSLKQKSKISMRTIHLDVVEILIGLKPRAQTQSQSSL